ncbi:MAG: S-adenosylmethionine synthetase N-terminal domain-containing protein [Erysipelotrichaceae bacterium]|nr:S-adenosylmethionine synthetase N-terminal domain-containing protein [Erysipelotrichaceae bacterium]
MIEKVNPCHPDKVADRIAGAIVDLAYQKKDDPKVAAEVLLGHGICHIIVESDVEYSLEEVDGIVKRIAGNLETDLKAVRQDIHLSDNQKDEIRCGDNGIFRGMPLSDEQKRLSCIAREIYERYPSDGKYILADDKLIICQSKAKNIDLQKMYPDAIINPLGEWSGGSDVDAGATNRKLGSDMADSVTGGGLHGKDLSKADVSVNIYSFKKAQETGKAVEMYCAIGDRKVCGIEYKDIVEEAREYIKDIGGFEKFAEWGLY